MTRSKLSATNIIPPPVATVAAVVAPPWRRRCHCRGANAAFSLPPQLPSLCRRRCLLFAAAAAFSSLLLLPSHRRHLHCRLRCGTAAAALPSADVKRPPWHCPCLLFAAAAAFLLPPPPLPHLLWRRCRRPPPPMAIADLATAARCIV